MEAERSAAGGGHRRGWVRRHGIPASWLAEFRRMGIRQGSRPAVAVVGGTAEAFVRRPDAGSLGRMALEPQAVVRSSLYEAKPEYESDLALPFFALDPSGTGTGTDGNEIGRNPLVSVKAMLFKKNNSLSPFSRRSKAGCWSACAEEARFRSRSERGRRKLRYSRKPGTGACPYRRCPAGQA